MGDVVLTFSATGASTVVSGPIANPGAAADIVFHTSVTAIGGSPTLAVSLEVSDDNSSWSALTGSVAATISAVGTRSGNGRITKPYVRVTATIAGTATPTITGRVLALVIPE